MTLPSGEVTLLFTDIEGSTKMLYRLGEAYADVLHQHRDILRAAFRAHEGAEVDTQGDAFFVAFPRASAALAAAAAAQRGLASAVWPDESSVKVRMGVHTGHPALIGEGYVGIDVHKGARISAAGYGGQILVSEETVAALVGHASSTALRDLGEHRLKDLGAPEHLYQLMVEGLPQEFPPLHTISPSNLPADVSTLIGRAREVEEVSALLATPGVRQVTLTGVGGTGKTRLAIAVGRSAVEGGRFTSGTFFVPLAPLVRSSLVPSAIAAALGVASSDQPVVEAIKAHIGDKAMLLILDNFEHLIDAAGLPGDLLRSAQNLSIMVTSRMRLRTTGEHEYRVLPLSVPERTAEDVASLRVCDAVALFEERASGATHDFELSENNAEAVAEICRRLDGLPLAIELAAARVRTFAPEILAKRLSSGIDVLAGGARDLPKRQRTLRATLEWSHDLLPAEQQTLFARLGVFAGGFTAEAVSQVCADPAAVDVIESLEGLLDASLVQQDRLDAGRYVFLETVREFARERLKELPDLHMVLMRHAEYFRDVAEEAAPRLRSREQDHWIARLEHEHDNLRAAIGYALGPAPQLAMRIATALVWFWEIRGDPAETRSWLQRVADRARDVGIAVDPWVLFGLGRIAIQRDELDSAEAPLNESLRLFTERGDERGRVEALSHLGWVFELTHRENEARRLQEEGVAGARAANDEWALGAALSNLAECHGVLGSEYASRLFDEALRLRRRRGDRYGIAITLNGYGYHSLLTGDLASARALLEESLAIGRGMRSPKMIAYATNNLAYVRLGLGDIEAAADLFDESTVLALDLGMRGILCENLSGIALIVARHGSLEVAAQVAGLAARLHADMDQPVTPQEHRAIEMLMNDAPQDETWRVCFERGHDGPADETTTAALEQLRAAMPRMGAA